MCHLQLIKNLRYLRSRIGFTQEMLGKVLNISRQAYSNYENGKREIDLATLIHLAKFYGISLDQLVLENLRNESSTVSEEKIPYYMALDIETGNTLYLQKEETEFILKYRDLSDTEKQLIDGYMDSHSR